MGNEGTVVHISGQESGVRSQVRLRTQLCRELCRVRPGYGRIISPEGRLQGYSVAGLQRGQREAH